MADLTGQNIQDTYQKVVQIDNNQLQDGTGSNLPISIDGNNVIVSGSIIANEYIVSSSVTNITIATKSGSTAFGNSVDDVHTLIGDVRLKGNETVTQQQSVNLVHSTSSYNQGGMLDFTTGNYAPLQGGPNYSVRIRTNAFDDDSGGVRTFGMDVKGNLYLDDFAGTSGQPEGRLFAQGTISGSNGVVTTFISASSHITSTGDISAGGLISTPYNISASGQIHGQLLKTDGYLVGDISQPTELSVSGKITAATTITAAGNISSSGHIIGAKLFTDSELSVGGARTIYRVSGNTHFGSLDTMFSTEGTNVRLNAPVTASGNISSSGLVTSDKLKVLGTVPSVISSGLTIGSDSPTNATLKVDGDARFESHITASGDISASGTIYSKTPKFFTVGGWLKSSNVANYYGPHKQGPNNSTWNKSYGTDPSGPMSRLYYNSGVIVPEDIVVTGFKATLIPNGAVQTGSYTASLYVGQECLNNQINNPSLVLVQSEDVVGPANSGPANYMGVNVENYDSQEYHVSASSMIYPRFKWNTTKELFVNLMIQYYRVKR